MNSFLASLWAETLKARHSKVPLLASIGFTLAPLMDGQFMFIIKDPERAREMGLLSVKAHLTMSTADSITFFSVRGLRERQYFTYDGIMRFRVILSFLHFCVQCNTGAGRITGPEIEIGCGRVVPRNTAGKFWI